VLIIKITNSMNKDKFMTKITKAQKDREDICAVLCAKGKQATS
jgi:hypothetical protein